MAKGANTKQLIVEKSAELFNVFGFHGTSLRDIMNATELKKGGIYNHFQNKDEIALEAFDFAFAKVLKRFRDRLNQAENSLQKLHSIIDVFASFGEEPVLPGGCPVGNTAVDATDSHPALKQKAVEAIRTLHRYVEIKVEEGIENGEFTDQVNPGEIATLLLSALEGSLLLSRALGDPKYMQTTADYCKNYIEERLIPSTNS